MHKTIIIRDDGIDILKDGYNIIEQTIHGEHVPQTLVEVLTYAIDNLDMDNMNAINLLFELKEALIR